MGHTRHGLKALGLCLIAALGLIALSATAAQAAGFDIEGTAITAEKDVTAESDSTSYILLVPKSNLETLCKVFELDFGKIFPDGKTLAELLYKECDVLEHLSPLNKLPCWVQDNVKKILNEIHIKVEDKLIEHKGKVYDLFFPHGGGTTFVTLEFTGAECPLPLAAVPITGSVVAEECTGTKDLKVKKVSQLIQEAAAGLFPSDGLFFGKNPATLIGSVILKLGGAEAGKEWNGLAP